MRATRLPAIISSVGFVVSCSCRPAATLGAPGGVPGQSGSVVCEKAGAAMASAIGRANRDMRTRRVYSDRVLDARADAPTRVRRVRSRWSLTLEVCERADEMQDSQTVDLGNDQLSAAQYSR